jgi:hypothetical protein
MDLTIETPEGAVKTLRTQSVLAADGEEWFRFYYINREFGVEIEVEVMRTRQADFTAWIEGS